MEVRAEKTKKRAADDPVIPAQAAEWIHMGVLTHSSVMDPTSTSSSSPTLPAYVFTYIWLYIHMNQLRACFAALRIS